MALAYPGVLRLIGTDERRVLHFAGDPRVVWTVQIF